MYRSILVPLDGSAFGEQALAPACSLAAAAGAVLHLTHVDVIYPVMYVEGLPVIDAEIQSMSQAHARAYLDGVADRVRAEQPALAVEAQILSPPIATSLAEYAVARSIDLIVMTTHGRGGLARAWLGSVADTLVRHSAVPILLLRPHPDDLPPAAETLTRVLIPLDGSPLAEQILEPALELGRLTGASFTLLQVVVPFDERRLTPGLDLVKTGRETNQHRETEARAYLERIAGEIGAGGHTVETRVILAPQPASAILDAIADTESDLIAVATHGHGGLTRLLIGSVADKIVRGTNSPVLLYRPREVAADGGRTASATTHSVPTPTA